MSTPPESDDSDFPEGDLSSSVLLPLIGQTFHSLVPWRANDHELLRVVSRAGMRFVLEVGPVLLPGFKPTTTFRAVKQAVLSGYAKDAKKAGMDDETLAAALPAIRRGFAEAGEEFGLGMESVN